MGVACMTCIIQGGGAVGLTTTQGPKVEWGGP